MKALRTVALSAALLATQEPAFAGRTCEQRQPEAVNVQRSLDLALRTARRLDDSGAQVVILARAGQDLSRWQLRWSHLGYAYRETAAGGWREGEQGPAVWREGREGPAVWREGREGPAVWREGREGPAVWRVVHKLNACGSARGDLYRQGLGEFFMDDLHDYQAAWVVPNADIQARLLPLLRDNQRIDHLHTPAYNMVAYPWSQRYQQSNQWALETLAMAMEPGANTRERAQAWLQFRGYEPTVLRIDALKRLGARMGSSHIAFDDHPNGKRFADRIETVTVDSVFDWLQREGMAQPVQVLR